MSAPNQVLRSKGCEVSLVLRLYATISVLTISTTQALLTAIEVSAGSTFVDCCEFAAPARENWDETVTPLPEPSEAVEGVGLSDAVRSNSGAALAELNDVRPAAFEEA
jgi:hypothetical protein